jgi:RNA polymerase sigma-70 factor (ECF subfamily)
MSSSAVTRWLDDWREGDSDALSMVVPELYAQLRRTAAGCLRREFRAHTLQPTALVHEAYARLAEGPPARCNDRNHFLGIVRRLMGQILQQYARQRKASKRGGQNVRIPLEEDRVPAPQPTSAAEALDEALERLRRFEPRRFLIIEMRYQFGSSVHEIAAATKLSVRTVERELTLGRAWLEQAVFGESSA